MTAAAMIHHPEILILDEPTSGLDPAQIIEIRKLIRDIGKEKTIILCTHILQEVSATCNQVIIINEGKIVVQESSDQLEDSVYGYDNVIVSLQGDLGRFVQILEGSPGYIRHISSEEDGGFHRIKATFQKGHMKGEEMFEIIRENGWALSELYREGFSLEDIFLKLTGGAEEEGE